MKDIDQILGIAKDHIFPTDPKAVIECTQEQIRETTIEISCDFRKFGMEPEVADKSEQIEFITTMIAEAIRDVVCVFDVFFIWNHIEGNHAIVSCDSILDNVPQYAEA